MKTEGLTNSKFASLLGIQRSNITHIIDGRNKPSISFIEKLITKFPHVNIEWLITGTGEMYKQKEIPGKKSGQKENVFPTLFPEQRSKQSTIIKPEKITEPKSIAEKETATEKTAKTKFSPAQIADEVRKINIQPENPEHPSLEEPDLTDNADEREIECVLIFHSDKTFKYYRPK
jgi:transcriptional regulator with XRE-family HTH domain